MVDFWFIPKEIACRNNVQRLKIAKVGIGLEVWCSPGINMHKPDSGGPPVKSKSLYLSILKH